jgi:hypothetical protein
VILKFFKEILYASCLFMFGLEIRRLVYEKNVIWNIERFLSSLTFYPPKKVALPFIRVEINTLVCSSFLR